MDPVKDIARYCGISEAKVKTLLFRMRSNLREYLRKEGFAV
jgi:RNA polymerase sigma-70 factor (ECF subfamily)